MSYFKAKMYHQIRFQLGLSPDPAGELAALPQPLAGLKGSISKARGEEGKGGQLLPVAQGNGRSWPRGGWHTSEGRVLSALVGRRGVFSPPTQLLRRGYTHVARHASDVMSATCSNARL